MMFALMGFSGFSQGSCSYQFVDNGGASDNYLPNSNNTYTLCPSAPNENVTVTFTSFDTEVQYDAMFVYDGSVVNPAFQISSTNAPGQYPITEGGSFWGTDIPGPFTSSAPDGCLTFVFKSDSALQRPGWIANVLCVPNRGFQLFSFLDVNANGSKDGGEPNFPDSTFTITSNNTGIVTNVNSYNGVYVFVENDPANNYSISCNIDPSYNNYYTSATSFSNVNIGTYNGLLPIRFPITNSVNFNDLSVNCINLSNPRAGFGYFSKIIYRNNGNQLINGTINFTNDPLTPVDGTSEPVTTLPNGFSYNFSNLFPFETRVLNIHMTVPSIPIVSIGQSITNTVSISSQLPDNLPADNDASVTGQVFASYDPNDITEAHGPEILFSSFAPNNYLTYTIRFENTGNEPAEKVRITNPLDAAIDETSVKIVASSNNYVVERIANNLTFKFDNIQLPPSVPNSTIGKGFVTYKAKLKPGFAVGTIIPNAAKIYFDTNPAIDTNIFETKFVSVLANANFNALNDFKIYPNPVKNLLSISNKNNIQIQSAEISNMLGQTLQMSINNNNIDVSDLKSGNYMLKIVSDKGISNTKFIKE